MSAKEPKRKRNNPDEFVLTDIEVLKWFVKPGDRVKAFDKLLEVQSDKATVEITSKHDGVVRALGMPEGKLAKVGQVLVYFEGAEAPPSAPTAPSTPVAAAVGGEEESKRTLVVDADKVLSTPAVRHLAREHGIDLAKIKGSGKDGRVMKSDVLSFLQPQVAAPVPTPVLVSTQEDNAPMAKSAVVVAISGIRKEMAKAMTQSLTIPHMTLMEQVDVTEAHRLVKQTQGAASLLGVFIKCTSLALLDFPHLNSSPNSEVTELTIHPQHDIGVAMDTPGGLLVPVIRQVETKSVLDICQELDRFKLSQGKLERKDLVGATFTLSNIGSVGGGYATPLIAPPQAAIGAFGRALRVPVFASPASLEVREARMMPVSWAADHRVLDGAYLAKFSNKFKHLVENPMAVLVRLK
ncbi:hypothetical protein BASA81_003782 [Batrachochytrium salamandrivorans]|nr:hypothetical protein BASA81_003782 [Batrachochytrium salamandrivorans]